MADGDLTTVVNYTVPVNGQGRAATFQDVFTPTPVWIDFRALQGSDLAGTPFRPSGVYIDNTLGTGDLIINFGAIGYRIVCPAASMLNLPYPAPVSEMVSIIGAGQASVIFVDYPVIPFLREPPTMSGPTTWGTITGVLSNQTDLQNALNLLAPINNPTFTGTVNGITAAMIGLGMVNNTSDLNKPISTATQAALNLLAPIASPTFTGTVSGITQSMVGLGNVNNTSDLNKPISTATQNALNLLAPLASPTFTGTVSGITAAMVGLGNVNNTSDLSKPISTLTQTALNTKVTNPMTTPGDLIVGGAAGAPTRLAIGSAGQVLNVTSGVETWHTPVAADMSDYVVTSWTPVLTFATPGNLSVTYATQTGNIIKVGTMVTAQFVILVSSFTYTTASGNMQITGLPYTANANSNSRGSFSFQGINATGYTSLAPRVSASSNIIDFQCSGMGMNVRAIMATDVASGSPVVLSGTIIYFI